MFKYKIVIKTDDDIFTVLYKWCNDIYEASDYVKSRGYSYHDIEEIIKVETKK